MVFKSGQTPSGEIFEMDAINGHLELSTHIRADFTTMSVVTVSAVDFFPYESREQFRDRT